MSERERPEPLPETLPAHWDPDPSKREYVRNATTGDLGWLVRRGGSTFVRLDRPMEEIIVGFAPAKWYVEPSTAPMSKAALTRVAFEADKALAFALGDHLAARGDWLMLSEQKRLKLMSEGLPVGTHPLRRLLWESVIETLNDHAQ